MESKYKLSPSQVVRVLAGCFFIIFVVLRNFLNLKS